MSARFVNGVMQPDPVTPKEMAQPEPRYHGPPLPQQIYPASLLSQNPPAFASSLPWKPPLPPAPVDRQWYVSHYTGACRECEGSGYQEPGHNGCNPLRPAQLPAGIEETKSRLVNGSWELLVFCDAWLAEAQGWEVAS